MEPGQSANAIPLTALTPVILDDRAPGAAAGRPLGAISTLVSLFLLLLVFFVLLFSIAEVHRQRTRDVLNSVDIAFGGLPSRLGLIPPATLPPTETATEEFIQTVSLIITGFAPLSPHDQPDGEGADLLRADVPVAMLFEPGTATLTKAAIAMTSKLAVLMQARPGPKQHYQMIFRNTVESAAPSLRALRLEQATSFAAALFEAGCPPEALQAELRPGTAEGARLEFRLIGSGAEADP